MSSRSGKLASKSDVSCKDTKVTSEAICEALQGLNSRKAECRAESSVLLRDNPEPRDSDHREWSGDSQKDETDYREWRNVEKGEAAHRKSPLLSSESGREREDQDPNTTDPLLAHELLVPYDRMPRPRIFRIIGNRYVATLLPRRPQSPVRHILPGRFNLRARVAELLKRQSFSNAHGYLWEFKDRISQSVKQVSYGDIDFDLIICMLVLRALCEQVILAMAGANTGTDVHTFVNTAIIWALTDPQILDTDTLNEQERITLSEFESEADTFLESREMDEAVASSKLRGALFEAHRSKFGPHISTKLHRCLPWTLVGPAHQRGVLKFYSTVRKRIDEILPDQLEYAKSAYVPDLTCFHFRKI